MQRIQLEAAHIVAKVINQGRNLNEVLATSLAKLKALEPYEKSALQDLCYGTLRHYTRLNFILQQLLKQPLKIDTLQNLLLVALYQLQYTRVGSHVVVDQAVCAAKVIKPATTGLANAILRNYLRQKTTLLAQADQQWNSRYSYPDWWIEKLSQQYGVAAETILDMGNSHPPMTLRINQRKTNIEEYTALLAKHEIEAKPVGLEALMLVQAVPVERLPHFAEGWVSVQDLGAQYAAHLLEVETGMRVLDACTAPGGKAGHLLERAEVDLLALDKDEARLQRVRDNLARLQLAAEIKCGDVLRPQDWWDGQLFQCILADVPCSASGVVRRHPDIKWLRQAQDVPYFAQQQLQILQTLWPLLENGGRLLYATCSIFADENQQVVADFLAIQQDAVTLPLSLNLTGGQLQPSAEHDGFFYALLQKQA